MGLGLGLGVDVSQLWTEPLLLVHPGQMVVSADATNDSTYMWERGVVSTGAALPRHTGQVSVPWGQACARRVQCAGAYSDVPDVSSAHRPVPAHSPIVLLAHLITLM